MGNELKTLQSRLEDSINVGDSVGEGGDEGETGLGGLGEAERKHLVERAEQAEDRAILVIILNNKALQGRPRAPFFIKY